MSHDTDEITWVADLLPDPPAPDGAATDRARLALQQHMSAGAPHRRPRRITMGVRLGALGAAATAAVGGFVLAAGGSGSGSGGAGAPRAVHHATTTARIAAVPKAVHHSRAAHAVHGRPVLLRLADDVNSAPPPPGDAALVVHHNTFPNAAAFSGIDLYEDDGSYYGATMDELRQAVADPSQADKQLGGILTAAAQSANVSPAQAAQQIYEASPAPSGGGRPSASALAARAAKLKAAHVKPSDLPPISRQEVLDNYLWMNVSDALEGGAGRADVRAGAMLAASTLPDVHVTQTTWNGHDVVSVTNTQFSDNYEETLDLDAHTGVLIHMRGGTVNGPASVNVTYDTTRVNTPGLQPQPDAH